MRVLATVLAALLGAGGMAQAAELQLSVRTPAGAPVENAVVTVYPDAGSHAVAPADDLQMAQKGIAFTPYVLIAPVGSTISFPNQDKVRHHVYSFSPAHRFELKLYGREEHRSEHFDKVGVVALGCNIHDRMQGYIDVVDTRFAGKTDTAGTLSLTGLPAGPAVVKVWQPHAKAKGATVVSAVTLAGETTTQVVTMELWPPAPGKQDH